MLPGEENCGDEENGKEAFLAIRLVHSVLRNFVVVFVFSIFESFMKTIASSVV